MTQKRMSFLRSSSIDCILKKETYSNGVEVSEPPLEDDQFGHEDEGEHEEPEAWNGEVDKPVLNTQDAKYLLQT